MKSSYFIFPRATPTTRRQLATHKHSHQCMDAYLTGEVDRSAAALASPPPLPPLTTTSIYLLNHQQPSGQPPAGTATVLRASVGIHQKTSLVRPYFSAFEPPVGKKIVKCTVVPELPASGWLPARNQQLHKFFTHNRVDPAAGKKAPGQAVC